MVEGRRWYWIRWEELGALLAELFKILLVLDATRKFILTYNLEPIGEDSARAGNSTGTGCYYSSTSLLDDRKVRVTARQQRNVTFETRITL